MGLEDENSKLNGWPCECGPLGMPIGPAAVGSRSKGVPEGSSAAVVEHGGTKSLLGIYCSVFVPGSQEFKKKTPAVKALTKQWHLDIQRRNWRNL